MPGSHVRSTRKNTQIRILTCPSTAARVINHAAPRPATCKFADQSCGRRGERRAREGIAKGWSCPRAIFARTTGVLGTSFCRRRGENDRNKEKHLQPGNSTHPFQSPGVSALIFGDVCMKTSIGPTPYPKSPIERLFLTSCATTPGQSPS